VDYHLVQLNTGKMSADFDAPVMSGFVQRLDEINALADESKGFVWRFQTTEGDATYLQPFEDIRILFNMSVWETHVDLRNFVYASIHVELLKSKASWFAKHAEQHLLLLRIQKDHIPSVEEALDKLSLKKVNGPSPAAFRFSRSYPEPSKAPQPTSKKRCG